MGLDIPEKWSFDAEGVADNFNQHVREQLPWYDMMWDAVDMLLRHYVSEGCAILDVGASTGELMRRCGWIDNVNESRVMAIEPSEKMAKVLSRDGLYDKVYKMTVDWYDGNRRYEQDYPKKDVILCILTVQFWGQQVNQKRILGELYENHLNDGGVLIVVDKFEQAPLLSLPMKRLGWEAKLKNGATYEDVMKKELSLVGVQVPLPKAYEPRDLICKIGELFFKYGEFEGWICQK